MKKTPMPTIAGVLAILSGTASILAFLAFLVGGMAAAWTIPFGLEWAPGLGLQFAAGFAFKTLGLGIGVIALIGGIFAIQRKHWGWAMAGSVCALAPVFVFGVAAIILTAVARPEFAAQNGPEPTAPVTAPPTVGSSEDAIRG